jgi:hypothetical protein
MVHRDPETGQFLAHGDDEPVELTYADHEFVNYRIDYRDNDTDGDRDIAEFQVEDDVLDLENDELGMLSWLTAVMVVTTEFETPGEQAGEVGGTVIVGSNLSGTEYLNEPAVPGTGVEEIRSTEGTAEFSTANDEPGVWAVLTAAADPQFEDAAQGAAGGGSSGHDRLRRVYYEETRGGPYIDATDDISIGISTQTSRTEEQVLVRTFGQMSFVVFEYENRRAEFAPYDPGPSMG